MTRWRWMQGKTLRRRDGTYLARIVSDEPTRNPHAVMIARRWEIEGYGPTPEAAIADLLAKVPELKQKAGNAGSA